MEQLSEAILKHRCCICKSPLSVTPITTDGQELYKCGRCKVIKPTSDKIFCSAALYEEVARHFSFPCRYNQCNEKIPWGAVERHERNCPHRTFCCPLFDSGCLKVLKLNELVQHFRDSHAQRVKTVDMVIKMRNQSNYVFLLTSENQHYIVYILSSGRIAVLSTQSNEYKKFDLKVVLSTDTNFSVKFESLPIVSFEDTSHCYMCIREKCEQPHHPFSKKNKQSEMDLNSFSTKLENKFFNLSNGFIENLRLLITPISTATIVPENPLSPMPVSMEELVEQMEELQGEEQNEEDLGDAQAGVTIKSHEVNMRALKNTLTCPCCHMYMTATIYICDVGHSFCAQCKTRLRTCPLCRASLSDGRNYILEELVAQVALPCVYDDKGCTFLGKTPFARLHEEECPLRMQE